MKSSKEKRALIAGMIGCLLYVIGDFLFAATGKTQSTEFIGLMVKVAYLDMATWRMVVSIICGVLGTALYYIGFRPDVEAPEAAPHPTKAAEVGQAVSDRLSHRHGLLGLCPCYVYEHGADLQVYL